MEPAESTAGCQRLESLSTAESTAEPQGQLQRVQPLSTGPTIVNGSKYVNVTNIQLFPNIAFNLIDLFNSIYLHQLIYN